jgi:hypothetical protein
MKRYYEIGLMVCFFVLALTELSFAIGIPCDNPVVGVKNPNCASVPEPGMLALLSSGLAGVGLIGFLKRKKPK